MRTKQVRRAILDALKLANGYALEVEALRQHVGDLLRPPVSDEEWALHIDWLETQCHIVRIPSAIDDQLIQFSITERGRVLLQSL